MACGKPIIAGVEGEGGALVRAADCGLVCPPENPQALADCVLEMFRMPQAQRETMGRSGREYSRKHFDRNTQFKKIELLMQKVVQRGGNCVEAH